MFAKCELPQLKWANKFNCKQDIKTVQEKSRHCKATTSMSDTISSKESQNYCYLLKECLRRIVIHGKCQAFAAFLCDMDLGGLVVETILFKKSEDWNARQA